MPSAPEATLSLLWGFSTVSLGQDATHSMQSLAPASLPAPVSECGLYRTCPTLMAGEPMMDDQLGMVFLLDDRTEYDASN